MVATRPRIILEVIGLASFFVVPIPAVRVFLQLGLRIARKTSSGTLCIGAFPFWCSGELFSHISNNFSGLFVVFVLHGWRGWC